MAKTLKQILEVYKPKAADEQKFVDKHVAVKHDDVNGNKDDVFQGTNVKKIDRKKERHGYEAGEDEKVYEEVEQIDELSKDTLTKYRSAAFKDKADAEMNRGAGDFSQRYAAVVRYHKRKDGIGNASKRIGQIDRGERKNEEVEYVNEAKVGENENVKVHHSAGDREDIYTVHDKKTGKKTKHGLHSYTSGNETASDVVKKQMEKDNVHPAARSIILKHMTEAAEQIQEKLAPDASAGDYISDFQKSDAPQFKGKSKEKRRQMAIAAFLNKEEVETEEEQITEEIDVRLLSLYINLDEDNRQSMLKMIDDGRSEELLEFVQMMETDNG